MGAYDPTYPLLPIACFVSVAMLLIVLLTSFIRQSWNLGVTFLCFWLFWENLILAINTTIWSDNVDVKLYVYCDIVSHLQVLARVGRPMATLMITRRLWLIASLQSVDVPSVAARRRDAFIEWTSCLIIPLLVAGPIYYTNQDTRFQVIGGLSGCTNSASLSIVEFLTLELWDIIPPLLSITVYYPRVAWMFYRQNREINRYLRSNPSVSRTNYLRIIAVASIDILITLPFAIVNNLALELTSAVALDMFPLYWGWDLLHNNWYPKAHTYAELEAEGTTALVQAYFASWTLPVVAFAIFGLFGLTMEARASYWRVIRTACEWFGWKTSPHAGDARATPRTLELSGHSQGISIDAETGALGFVNPTAPEGRDQWSGRNGESAMHDSASESDKLSSVVDSRLATHCDVGVRGGRVDERCQSVIADAVGVEVED